MVIQEKSYHWELTKEPIIEDSKENLITEAPKEDPMTET